MKCKISEQSISYRTEIPLADSDQKLEIMYFKKFIKKGDWSSRPIIRSDYKLSFFATSGVVCVTGGRVYPILPGSILLLRPYESHFGNVHTSGVQEYFEFNIPPRLFANLRDGWVLLPNLTDEYGRPTTLIRPKESLRHPLFSLCYRLLKDMEEDTPERHMSCFATLLSFLSLLHECTGADSVPLLSNTPPLIVRAASLVDEQLAARLTVDSLAGQLFVSPSYLSRMFRQWLDISPYQYIVTTRISRACQLLDGTRTMVEVADLCGFEDCSNFIATFRRHIGLTPFQYARIRKDHLLTDAD